MAGQPETWVQYLFFYLQPELVFRRWQAEGKVLLCLPIFFAAELLTQGWKGSTLAVLYRPGRSRWWEIFSVATRVSGLRKTLSNLFYLGFIGYLAYLTGDYSLRLAASLNPWITLLIAILAYDFLMYWAHRLRHTNSWLWIAHEFHHSSTGVNLFTSYRTHPIDNLILICLVFLPIQLTFGIRLQDYVIGMVLAEFIGVFSHSRTEWDFGWLGRNVFVTPRFHHLHHALGPQSFRNYGHALVVWDRLFGTYLKPDQPIEGIKQGIKNNFYEYDPPIRAFLRPVWRFYAYPFSWLGNKIRHRFPAKTEAR